MSAITCTPTADERIKSLKYSS